MKLTVPEGRIVRANADLSDLTASVLTEPPAFDEAGTSLLLTFDREPTATERARIRLRLLTRDASEEARFVELLTALDGLKDDPSPYAVAIRALLNLQLKRVA